MAKKVRRVKKKRRSAPVAERTAAEPTEKPVSAKEKSVESFRQEYAYVIKDLRRLLLLSGAMFILLIVLNLLLQ